MLMLASTVDDMPLASGEFIKSGEDFISFNQNFNRTCYREHIMTLDDDSFISTCNVILTENSDAIKERKLKKIHVAMGPKQLPEKIASKLMVRFFCNQLETVQCSILH